MNETGYKVVFNNLYVPKGSLNATILQLVALFESRNEEWIDNFPIVVDENGNFAFKQDDGMVRWIRRSAAEKRLPFAAVRHRRGVHQPDGQRPVVRLRGLQQQR